MRVLHTHINVSHIDKNQVLLLDTIEAFRALHKDKMNFTICSSEHIREVDFFAMEIVWTLSDYHVDSHNEPTVIVWEGKA